MGSPEIIARLQRRALPFEIRWSPGNGFGGGAFWWVGIAMPEPGAWRTTEHALSYDGALVMANSLLDRIDREARYASLEPEAVCRNCGKAIGLDSYRCWSHVATLTAQCSLPPGKGGYPHAQPETEPDCEPCQ